MVFPPMDPRAPEHKTMMAQIQRYQETTKITIQTVCKCGRENPATTVSLEQYDKYRNHEISAFQMCDGDLSKVRYFISSRCTICTKNGVR